jgi:hypothetical protein
MRNPIQPSPDRPIPLPDCILMDAWWADRTADTRDRSPVVLRLVSGNREEGQHDRSNREQRAD